MAATAKTIVRKFLNSDVFLNPDELRTYFSKDFTMSWHASSGHRSFNFDDYYRLCKFTSSSYTSVYTYIKTIIQEKEKVAAMFTVYVRTIENPGEEIPICYFISIFDISNGLITAIHQSSHQKLNN